VDALGPDFEFTPDPSFPDVATYRGEELRRWLREWADTWQGNRLEVLETSEQGPAVMMVCRWHLGAPQTGDEIPIRDFTIVIWFDSDDDQPRRMAAFFDHDRALAAVAETPG